MKKAVALSYFLFLLVNMLYAQTNPENNEKIKVAIIPISCDDSDQYLSVASRTVVSTLELVLGMSGRYEVIIESSGMPENIPGYCEKHGIPNLIHGKSFFTEKDEIVFELAVYNIEKNEVIITKREIAETVLDVFTAADTLALTLAESFSGMQMVFGKVKLISMGDRGEFRVRIGESLTVPESDTMEMVLAGKRVIEIIQYRMFGSYTVITYEIEILENQITDIVFYIPGFTSAEMELVKKKEALIKKHLSSFFNKREGIKKAIEIYNELIEEDLAITDYSRTAFEKKNKLIEERELLVSSPASM